MAQAPSGGIALHRGGLHRAAERDSLASQLPALPSSSGRGSRAGRPTNQAAPTIHRHGPGPGIPGLSFFVVIL